jgi:hypothetical protein
MSVLCISKVLESPNFPKRFRMSQFVQQGKMSFEKAEPDPFPKEDDHWRTFHILLRTGMFSLAKVVPNGFGGLMWAYPIRPFEFMEKGTWMADEVVAWKEATDLK